MRLLAGRLLGIDPHGLTGVEVKIISGAEFRSLKGREQRAYWKMVQKGISGRSTFAASERVKHAAVVHPRSFRLATKPGNGNIGKDRRVDDRPST